MMWQGIDKNTPRRCLGPMKIQKSWKTKTFQSVVTTVLVIFMYIIFIYISRSYIDTTTFIHVYDCDDMVENNLDS